MCGRFSLTTTEYLDLSRLLGTEPLLQHVERYRPRYNIAPGTDHWIVVGDGERSRLKPARWGFIPKWSKDGKEGWINSRIETAHEKPAFRSSFRSRRCAIPANGFFEWKKEGDGKNPYWFYREKQPVFLFAGLFDDWVDAKTDQTLRTFAILTTGADAFMKEYHHRRPVILNESLITPWISGEPTEVMSLQQEMMSLPMENWQVRRVSRYVNSPAHDDPGCIEAEEGNGV